MISRNFLLVILLSLLPLVAFLSPQLLHTHDGFVHLARIAAYKRALVDGEFPVRWAGDLNYGYGMPLFNFIYELPYFIASLFLFLGAGLVVSFKLTLALSFLLAGAGTFLFTKELFGDSKKAFFVAIFYQFAPFRLVELLIRGSLGEVYAYAFAPFIFYFLTRFLRKNKPIDFVLTALFSALLVLSHNALSLVFFGAAAFYVLLLSKNVRQIIFSALALLWGLLLSLFYWAPALLEHKYTYGDLFMKDIYTKHFPPIQNFFIPNFLNSSNLQTGGISVQFGLFHVIGIALAILVVLKKKTSKEQKNILLFSTALLVISLFFMLPISAIVWQKVSLLRQFQFPWRFLGLVAFVSAISSISYFSFDFIQKKWAYSIILFLTVATTAFYWKPPLGFDKINESYYWNYPLNTTYFGETDLIWSAGQAYSYPKARVEVIDGQAVVSNFTKKTTVQTFNVTSESEGKLVDHTQYYPGWTVYINGVKTNIEYQFQKYPGQLVFKIPQGKSTVKVVFEETKTRLLTDIISLVSFLGLIGVGLFKKYLK